MLSRLGQSLHVVAPNMAGGGLLERLRNATIAMFAAVTAVGLALVLVAANQGWPRFADSPLPLLPIERIGEAQVAEEPSAPIAAPAGPQGRPVSGASARQIAGGPESGTRSPSQQAAQAVGPGAESPGPAPTGQASPEAPATSPPAAPGPAPAAAAPPAPAPVQSAPAPSPPAATPPSTKQAPGGGNGKAKGHEKSGVPSGQAAPAAPADPPQKSIPEGPAQEAPSAPSSGDAPAKESGAGNG
jgi:hypothetical protein